MKSPPLNYFLYFCFRLPGHKIRNEVDDNQTINFRTRQPFSIRLILSTIDSFTRPFYLSYCLSDRLFNRMPIYLSLSPQSNLYFQI